MYITIRSLEKVSQPLYQHQKKLVPINLRSYKKSFTHREIFLSIFSGIFLVDRTRYPKNRLNPLKLEEYNIWKMSGDPLNWDRVANGR